MIDTLQYLLRFLLSSGAGGYLVYLLFANKVAKKRVIGRAQKKGSNDIGALDCRRKAQISGAKPTDHAGEVVVVSARNFDLNRTIFQSLEGFLPRAVIRSQVAVELFWSDSAVERIAREFAVVPKPPAHNQDLLDFMRCDCDFAMEHADGSFLDHLQFCYEYSVANYKGHSPRVLFLHSIMGVGTNFFPMQVEKEPKLKGLLTDVEFAHIEAFPSFVRLLNTHALVGELRACNKEGRLKSLRGIRFHRVIDNAEIELDAAALWVQLNYQVVHLLDFLPVSNWGATADAPLFQVFTALFALMTEANKLEAKIDFDLTAAEPSAAGLPVTLGGLISQVVPSGVKKNMSIKAVTKFSKKIGHSLDYTLLW